MELTTTHKTIIFFVLFAIAIIIIAFIFKVKKEKQQENKPINFEDKEKDVLANEIDKLKSQLNDVSSKQETNSTQYNDSFPLRIGSVGKRVEQLQIFLKSKWNWQGRADGKWGNETQKAVENYFKQKEISQMIFEAYNLSIIKTQIYL